MLRMDRLDALTTEGRVKVRAAAQRVLDDPVWQAKVLAESAKIGHTPDHVFLQATSIIEYIDSLERKKE